MSAVITDVFLFKLLLSFVVGGCYIAAMLWVAERFGSKIGGILIGLPSNLLDVETQLRPDCGVRLSGSISSFIVVGRGGKILYSGRIDNFYAGLGKPRRQATEHDLRTALEEMLAGKAVTTPRTDPVGCYISPPGI